MLEEVHQKHFPSPPRVGDFHHSWGFFCSLSHCLLTCAGRSKLREICGAGLILGWWIFLRRFEPIVFAGSSDFLLHVWRRGLRQEREKVTWREGYWRIWKRFNMWLFSGLELVWRVMIIFGTARDYLNVGSSWVSWARTAEWSLLPAGDGWFPFKIPRSHWVFIASGCLGSMILVSCSPASGKPEGAEEAWRTSNCFFFSGNLVDISWFRAGYPYALHLRSADVASSSGFRERI